jgi:hypothetical protein
MWTNLDIRIINLVSKVAKSPLHTYIHTYVNIFNLDSFTSWVGLHVTFSVYVWFHSVWYKSRAPEPNYIHWERFVRTIHFVASTESSCFTTLLKYWLIDLLLFSWGTRWICPKFQKRVDPVLLFYLISLTATIKSMNNCQ